MKDKDHKVITDHVLSHFKDRFSDTFQLLLQEMGSEIVHGAYREDKFCIERAKNWHFYKPENSPYLKPFRYLIGGIFSPFQPSSRKLCLELNQSFDKHLADYAKGKDNKKKLFFLIGRIIHHVQDMSTPSHVVPVFHGPSIFPGFKKVSDSYENWSVTRITDYLSDIIPESFSGSLESENLTDFMSLYDISAQRTLDYLESDDSLFNGSVNNRTKLLSTTLFWQKFDPAMNDRVSRNDGFGAYGPFEKHFGYDIENEKIGEDVYSITFSQYEHIFRHFTRKAVSDTFQSLLFVEERLQLT